MDFEMVGQIGDLLSGLFTAAGFVVVVVAAWKVVPAEMEKFRQQKRAEILADVARSVWQSVFRLSVELEGLCSPASVGPPSVAGRRLGDEFRAAWRPRIEQLNVAGNDYLASWGLSDLYFPQVSEALKALWVVRADILVSLEMYAANLDQPGVDEGAYKRVFGGESRANIDAHRTRLRVLLQEFAHVGIQGGVGAP
jgi:hypothetical protein